MAKSHSTVTPAPQAGQTSQATHRVATITTEQAGQLFSEIASIAEALDDHCYHLPVDADDAQALHAFIDQMRRSVACIGWMADKGAGGLGTRQLRGGAEDWMLSPTARKAMECTTTEGVSHGE